MMNEWELARMMFRASFGRDVADVRMPLHEAQAAFVHSEAHRLAFVAGISTGKSVAGALRGIRASLGMVGEGENVVHLPTPNLGMVTAPTYPMLRDSSVRTFLDLAEALVPSFDRVQHFNKSDMVARMPNGSEVLFRSVEHPDRLRGANLSWWWGDEAALYRSNVRQIMVGRLREGGRRGYEWLTTTPKGRNWVWQVYGKGRAGYVLVRARTADNPFLARDVVEEWGQEYSGDFARQELGGEFIAWRGLVYSDFDEGVHVAIPSPEAQYKRVVAGVDWGFANPGVILVVGEDGDGRAHVLAERYERELRVEEWAGIAADLRGAYGVERFYCDPSEPDYIKTFREAGLKADGADNAVMAGIQTVKNALVRRPDGKPSLMVAPSAVNLLAEVASYQWQEGREGLRDAPVKAHDHAMDALRYAMMGLRVKKKSFSANVRTGRYV
jgi:phage terminase large subunit